MFKKKNIRFLQRPHYFNTQKKDDPYKNTLYGLGTRAEFPKVTAGWWGAIEGSYNSPLIPPPSPIIHQSMLWNQQHPNLDFTSNHLWGKRILCCLYDPTNLSGEGTDRSADLMLFWVWHFQTGHMNYGWSDA